MQHVERTTWPRLESTKHVLELWNSKGTWDVYIQLPRQSSKPHGSQQHHVKWTVRVWPRTLINMHMCNGQAQTESDFTILKKMVLIYTTSAHHRLLCCTQATIVLPNNFVIESIIPYCKSRHKCLYRCCIDETITLRSTKETTYLSNNCTDLYNMHNICN